MVKLSKRYRALALASIVAVAPLLAACSSDSSPQTQVSTADDSTPPVGPKEFAGYVRNPPLDVSEVVLPTSDDTHITMVAQPGGIRLVYFGYTTCPDICPTTLAYVKKALEGQTPEDRSKVDVDMITVDPSVDTPELLSTYLERFVPDGNAIHTMDAVLLRAAANAFGASYRIQYEDGARVVAHTDDLYAVDDTGTVVLAWPFGHALAEVEQDLTRLLNGERPGVDSTGNTNPSQPNKENES